MLLNLVYGHSCGDQTIANVSSVQCAALVSLRAQISKVLFCGVPPLPPFLSDDVLCQP